MGLINKIKDNFNLNAVDQVYFWKSEWEYFDVGSKRCNVSAVYLTYRFLFMCYFVGSTIYNMSCTDMNLYFTFITKWSFTIQLVYSILFFLRLAWIRINRRKIETTKLLSSNYLFSESVTSNLLGGFSHQPKLPWPEKMIWIMVNLVSVIPYGVTIGYWIIIYDPVKMSQSGTCEYLSDILVHGANSPMAFLDSLIMAIPIRISHMIFPIVVVFIYSVFTGVYELAGGTYTDGGDYIYPILNWKNSPQWAIVTSFVVLIVAGVFHIIFNWGVYRLRVIIVKYFNPAIRNDNIPSKFESYQYQSLDRD